VSSGLKKLVIEGDRMACLLSPSGRSLFSLQLAEEVIKAARPCMREMMLLAVVQVKAQPLGAKRQRVIGHRFMLQMRDELRLQCGKDGSHAEPSSFWISFQSA